MKDLTKAYQAAVEKAIRYNHSLGLPVYQCKEGYIVALYPDGREVKLEKTDNRFSSPSR